MNKIVLILVMLSMMSAKIQAQNEEEPKPELTQVWEPEPPVVTPGVAGAPPSDGIILFDGSGFSEWVGIDGNAPKWQVENGIMTVVKKTGKIETKRKFGDCQLHVEWRTPLVVKGEGQGRGNSGIFLQNRYEVQVLDSYENRTYSNGQAGSVYKQFMPLVNACRKPGEWQTYDIIYTAPRFNKDDIIITPARITVVQNGILIQNNVELKGNTVNRGMPKYEAHGKAPIMLQDHDNPVSYRNIWIREL